MIADFLASKRGAGMKLVDAVAKHDSVTVDAVLSGDSSVRVDSMVEPGPLTTVLLRHPEWPIEVRQALRAVQRADFDERAWEVVGAAFAMGILNGVMIISRDSQSEPIAKKARKAL